MVKKKFSALQRQLDEAEDRERTVQKEYDTERGLREVVRNSLFPSLSSLFAQLLILHFQTRSFYLPRGFRRKGPRCRAVRGKNAEMKYFQVILRTVVYKRIFPKCYFVSNRSAVEVIERVRRRHRDTP